MGFPSDARNGANPTERELGVLWEVVECGTVAAAAAKLYLSPHTVETYLARLRQKSGRKTLAQMAVWAHSQTTPVRSKSPDPISKALEGATSVCLPELWIGLSEAQWAFIAPLIPSEKGGPGRRRADRRGVVNGILYKLRTGCSWEQVPAEFGNRNTCRRCYQEWKSDGTWALIWKQFFATLNSAEKGEWGRFLLESGWIPEISSR